MKRVLALILCLALCVLAIASCAPAEEHVHTYNETWSSDADGHWYAPNCGCEDAPRILELSHADSNNDGACDVCGYTEHTHTYAEEWTIDCTNHWNAADCGHTVAGTNVGAHVDEIYDGKCDVCGYVINDIHEHYYDSKWSSDETNHWHAPLCEHTTELKDVAPHELNDAGDCTVCGAKIKDVDMTDLLAVLKATVANNYKVAFGDVIASEAVYGGTGAQTLENGKTNKVHFALGNGESYIQYVSFNKNGAFIGQNEQWYEDLGNGEVFGAEMEYGEHELAPIAGAAQFLNGYNYIPGSIIPSDSADTSTLANMLYALYNQMNAGIRVKDAEQNIENGVYSFSYTYYSVNPVTVGGELFNVELEYYIVDVEFTVNDDLIIDTADFQVEVYRDYENDQDLDYTYTDNGDGTVTIEAYPTLKPTANPSFYNYSVSQMSGERTFTTPYPRASLLPSSFELLYVTETIEDSNGNKYPSVTEPIGERIELTSGTYAMFAIGDILPSTASSKFINTDDFTFTFVNKTSGSNARAWYMDSDAIINGYSAYNGCLKLKMRDPGEYTMTVAFGNISKSFTLIILGEPQTEISGDADSIDVLLSDFNTYDNEDQTYTYVADAEGNYTFTVPAGLGVRVDGENTPRIDFVNNPNGGSFTVGLNAGESVKLYFAAYDATKYTVAVSYVAADIPDPTPGEGEGGDEGGEGSGTIASDISGTYYTANGVLVINNDGTMTYTEGSTIQNYTYVIEGNNVTYTLNGNDDYDKNNSMASYFGYLEFGPDGMPSTFVYNGEHALSTTAPGGSEGGEDEGDDDVTLEGSGTEADPFVLPEAGDYVCAFPGQDDVVWYTYTVKTSGYVTVSTTFGQGGWIKLGTNYFNYVSNEGNGQPYEFYYPAGTVLCIGIGDYAAGTVDVPFTVAERAVTSDPINSVVGTWYGTGTTMFATVNYTLTVNADGTGTLVYNNFGSDVSCTLTYVLVEDEKVTVGYVSEYTQGSLACTYVADVFTCTSGINGESFTFSTTPPAEGGDEEEGDKVYAGGTVVLGNNIIAITDDDIAANSLTVTFVALHTTEYKFTAGSLFVTAVTGPDGEVVKDAENYWYSLVEGVEYTISIQPFFIDAAGDQDLNITEPNWVEPENDTADVLGYYQGVNGYNIFIFEDGNGGFMAEVSNSDYTIDIYFTVVASANGDGSYTLSLTYLSRPDYEAGVENVDAILAETFVVTPESGEGEGGEEEPATPADSVIGWYDLALNGNNIGLYKDTDTSVYTFNVYNDSGVDLYYSYVAIDNGDGTVSLALTFIPDHWASTSTTDTLGLDGKVVVATPAGESWTFALEGEGSGEEEPAGTFADPFVLGENNSCEFPGGMDYVFYKFTAQVAGTLTVTMTSDDFFWAYGSNEYALDTVGSSVASKDITLASGESVWIGISTNSMSKDTVTFTASFEASAGGDEEPEQTQGTFANPFELQEDNTCEFPGGYEYVFYKYVPTANGNLTITFTSEDHYLAIGYSESSIENIGGVATHTFAVEEGVAVYVGIATYTTEVGTVTFTSSFAAGEDEGEVTVNETPMILGNNSVNGSDINFAYTAESDIVLNVQVGTPVMSGVAVTYSIDGATAVAIANGTSVEVTLTAGQKLVVSAVTSGGFMTITVTEVAQETGPDGTENNPYVIETLPTEITFTGNHDKYYTYTATEDIVLTITAPAGCYVTNDAGATAVNSVYTITLAVGESVSLNLWTMSAAETEYVYTITGAAPVVDGGEGGGETTGAVTYISERHASGRYLKVTIDTAAGTMTLVRSNMSGGWDASTSTAEYTISGSGAGTTATNVSGQVCTIVFGDDGVPTSITWGTATFVNFTQQ